MFCLLMPKCAMSNVDSIRERFLPKLKIMIIINSYNVRSLICMYHNTYVYTMINSCGYTIVFVL